jgi:hypothetical protein
MGLILSYLNYKENDLSTNDCWDEIFISPSNIIKPAYGKESYNTDFFVYDFYHVRPHSVPIDYGIDILK